MTSDSKTLSLGQLIRPIITNWWIVLIATLVGAAAMFVYTHYLDTPKYSSTAKIGVNYVEMSEYQNAVMGQTISTECAEILVSNVTLNSAADRLNAYSFPENGGKPYRTYTYDNIRSMIKTTTTNQSRYFTVEVTAPDPKEAKIVCEIITKTFCDIVAEKDYIKGAEGKIIHEPVEPTKPSSPNLMLRTAFGGIIGLVIAAAVIIAISIFKDIIDGEDWLKETYKEKIPLLAVIPDANSSSGGYKKYARKYGYGYESHHSTDVTDAVKK